MRALNRKQKIVLWIGIVVIVLIGLFPPSRLACPRFKGPWPWWEKATILVLHHSIWNAGIEHMKPLNLFVEWSIAVVAATGLIYLWRDKRQEGESNE